MGYGKNLKEAADAQGISLRKLGLITGISPQTLYGAVKRDNGLRYDNALQIAEALAISPDLICKYTPANADTKAEEHINRTMKQLADAGKKEFICRQIQLLMTYDHEHLTAVERLLKRFGSMDLSEWECVQDVIAVILRHHAARHDRKNGEEQ